MNVIWNVLLMAMNLGGAVAMVQSGSDLVPWGPMLLTFFAGSHSVMALGYAVGRLGR